jgi:hypothetical protein
MSLAGLDNVACGNWMWMSHGADGGAESYKCIASRHYIWVDVAGNVYYPTGLQIHGPAIRQMLENGEVAA